MSKRRKEILPGADTWDCFYDKRVQKVLERRRTVVALQKNIGHEARLEFLAWPIVAFCAADGLARDLPAEVSRQIDFLFSYAADPTFVSELLVSVSIFHRTPESEKPLPRRVAEASNVSAASHVDFWSDSPDNSLNLLDWKDVADQIGCKNSVSQLKTEFHREKKRRLSVEQKWSENIAAWGELEALRHQRKETLLPLHSITFRDW